MTTGGNARPTLVLRVGPDDASAAAVARAAELLRAGRLVAFPTETVYGLGADATNPTAVEGIFAAKERPHSDPLIVHIADVSRLATVSAHIPEVAQRLAERFWPGPLTLIVPRGATVCASVAAGGETIGVRVPRHPVALALLRAAEVPVAAPSANRFMHTSPTTAAHVLADLDGRIDCVLDAGPCEVGVESTVLDLMSEPPRVVRPGGVTLEALRTVVPEVLGPRANAATDDGRVATAPGQMERHYAPRARLVVFDAVGAHAVAAMRDAAGAALARGERVGVLVADEEAEAFAALPVTVVTLGAGDDLAAVSRRLYAALRELDAEGLDVMLAHTFGTNGLGLAIWDRLRRAAGGTLQRVEG